MRLIFKHTISRFFIVISTAALLLIVLYFLHLDAETISISEIHSLNGIFSLFFAIDFTFYYLFSQKAKKLNHKNFVFFPMKRMRVLGMEFLNYMGRGEILLYVLITAYLNIKCFGYFKNLDWTLVLKIVVLSVLQYLFLTFLLLTIKNAAAQKENTMLRNIPAFFVLIITFINNFAEKSAFVSALSKTNPITAGLFSLLYANPFKVLSFVVFSLCCFIVYAIAKKNLKYWY